MKRISKLLAAVAVICLFANCSGTKDVAYFQNIENVDLTASKMLYDARIMPKDVLTITVSTTDPEGEAAIPFNLTVPTAISQGQSSTTAQPVLQSYLVDNEGSPDKSVGKIF